MLLGYAKEMIYHPPQKACCRRVLGCHPLLGCMEEELGGM